MKSCHLLSPSEMRAFLRVKRREEDLAAAEVARGLWVVEDRSYFFRWGYSSVEQYAERELGLGRKQVQARIRVARSLEGLPRMKKAFEEGVVYLSSVKTVVPRATPANEEMWLECMQKPGMTVRRLERLVANAKHDGSPPEDDTWGLPRNPTRLIIEVGGEDLAMVEAVKKQMEIEAGKPVSIAEVVLQGVRHLHETERVRLPQRVRRRARPKVAYVKCPSCGKAAVETRSGFEPVKAVPSDVRSLRSPSCGAEGRSPKAGGLGNAVQGSYPATPDHEHDRQERAETVPTPRGAVRNRHPSENGRSSGSTWSHSGPFEHSRPRTATA